MSDAGVDEDVVLAANEEKEQVTNQKWEWKVVCTSSGNSGRYSDVQSISTESCVFGLSKAVKVTAVHEGDSLVLRVGEPDVSHIDIKKARFPCCLVWTPLPIVAWLVPFIGHLGICREDGVILDFAGSCFVNVDNFAFGSTAKYLRLNPEKCCFPPHLSGHTCSDPFRHTDRGTAISWDDGVETTMRNYQHKLYNLFTCNCHSFVANALNRMAYRGSIKWNIVNVLALVFFKGQYVSYWALVRTYAPFVMVLILGLVMTGWPFLIAWSIFVGLLVTWFLIGTYCLRGLIES